MNALNLDLINQYAPYKVTTDVDYPYLFYFYTDFGVEYEICIKENNIFVPSGAFALDIRNKNDHVSPGDPKFKLTLMAIVEEFFRQNNNVMLYVTETKDSKQASRNRLFVRWFNTYERNDQYVIKTAELRNNGSVRKVGCSCAIMTSYYIAKTTYTPRTPCTCPMKSQVLEVRGVRVKNEIRELYTRIHVCAHQSRVTRILSEASGAQIVA